MTLAEPDPRTRLLKRCPQNPILTARDWPYRVNSVFNCAATRLLGGETLLLCRVEDCSGASHLCAARSLDGVTLWRIDPKPTFAPARETRPEEAWGIEDPRITWLPELQRYAVTYTCNSDAGAGVSLALTKDFQTFERIGNVLPPENRDAALLRERVSGRWAMIHRPVPHVAEERHIWISYSPDLRHWGDHKVIMRARRGPWWDATRIGLATPLVPTSEGWLLFYHGVKRTVSGSIYRVGLALLDRDDPSVVIRRANRWLMGPDTDYEHYGDVFNIVYPCGYTLGDDGDTINLYYGAADTSIALATGRIRELLAWLKDNELKS